MENCFIEECKEPVKSRNLCHNHYHREYRRGSFSSNICIARWCDKKAKGDSGNSRFCNSCYMRMNKYKLDADSYMALPDFCEVCGGKYRLSVDHDHQTGKIRGTLCSNCNPALGLLMEDVNIIKNLILYLEKHS